MSRRRDTDRRKVVDRAARRICHRGCDRGAAGRVVAAGGGVVDSDSFLQATMWQQRSAARVRRRGRLIRDLASGWYRVRPCAFTGCYIHCCCRG